MKQIFFIILLLLTPRVCTLAQSLGVQPSQKEIADSLYEAKSYQQACATYTTLLKSSPTSYELNYNLGNCHYRLNHIPEAILYYERALRIKPGDADTRHNLEIARSKTEDGFYSSDLLQPLEAFVNQLSADTWAIVSLIMLSLMLAFIIVLRNNGQSRVRRISYIILTLSSLVCVLSVISATLQTVGFSSSQESAIVMRTTPLYSMPDTIASKQTTLHGGSKITVQDTTISQWVEIQLPDGRRGWVPNHNIENI